MNSWSEITAVATELALPLGHWLVAQSVVVVGTVALVGVTARLCRRCHPKLLAGLWLVVFLRLLLPADLGMPASGLSLCADVLSRLGWSTGVAGEGWGESVPVVRAANAHMPAAGAQAALRWPIPVVVGWFVGMLTILGRRRVAWRQLRALCRGAKELRTPEIERMVEAWSRSFAVTRRVRVLALNQRIVPFTSGVLRPLVVIPQSLCGDASLLEAAVAHEMAHVARFDALWLALVRVCQLLYFFNPLVWFASSCLIHERERACDRLVVDRGEMAHSDYAHHLLDLAALGASPALVPALNSDLRRMTVRITSILEARSQSELSARKSLLFLCLFALFLLPIVATVTPAGAAPAATEEASAAGSQLSRAMQHPLPTGHISAPYGEWRNPFTKKPGFHRGVDLAAPEGSEVLAVAAGTVEIADVEYERIPAAGTVVQINHGDGVTSFYSHLGSLRVAAGDEVRRGQVIATVGMTGRTTGPHLHLELWEDGEHKNPAESVPELK